MAPRKRARTAGSSPTSASSDAPIVLLDGGEPLSTALVALWRAERLTDTVVTVEGGGRFPAHKLVLAAGAEFFSAIFESPMRDSAEPHLNDTSSAAFSPCLDFLYQGCCRVAEPVLPDLLRAANYLGIKPLESSAATALASRLAPSNCLQLWGLADDLTTVPELAEAAQEAALKGFEELGDTLVEEASLEQVQALVADERLTVKSEEAVFTAVQRFVEAQRPEEAAVLGLLRHLRFPLMGREFFLQRVRSWTMLQTVAGQQLLVDTTFGTVCHPRVGFGARTLYIF